MTRRSHFIATCSVAALLASASHAQDATPSTTVPDTAAAHQASTSQHASVTSELRAPLRSALIIGNNRSPRGALPDLQFADDDALRTAETLRAVLSDLDVVLLTRADTDTARLFGDAAEAATPPTRAAVEAAVAALAARFAQANAEGAETELFVVFSGHGERDQSGGYLELEDGALRRADLIAMLTSLKPRRAHIVLDACNSFFVVNARRPGGRPFVMRHEVEAGLEVPGVDVGVLLSTSADAQVYEWSQLSGGIFSHVLRSALSGAADANADGVLTYAELQGFMDVAVQDLPNAEYRPRLFMKATADDRFLALPNAPALRGAVGHVTVRDARGVRVLDAHPEAGFEPRLVLTGAAPFTVTRRGPDGRSAAMSLVVDDDNQTLVMSPTTPEDAVAMRGPPLVFDSLFAAAFGPAALSASVLLRQRAPEPVYGLSTAQLQRIALQLRIAGQKERQDRTATASGAIAVGGATLLAGVGGTVAGLSNAQRGFEDPISLAAFGPLLVIGGAIGAVWGGVQLFSSSDVEVAVAALDASGAVPSEAAAMEAISVVREETRRKESALLSDRDSLGLSGALSLIGAAGWVAMGTAPLLFGRDDLPINPFMVAAGGAYAGLGVGSLAMAAFHTATDGPDGEKLSTLAQLLQLIDEDPDAPSTPRAQRQAGAPQPSSAAP